jgi:peptidoglycan/xylan/chitin deacetylase (PgdA/CDA1 family)
VYVRTGGDEARDLPEHYLSTAQLRELSAHGMTLGAHSVSHRLLSQLPCAEQEREVQGSIDMLEQLLGQRVASFCYPYGGDHSFNADTLRLLTGAGIDFAFSVEARDIRSDDLAKRLTLPRYDCNVFPHGESRVGQAV